MASALALQGECPDADIPNYDQGLHTGDTCIRLIMQDGGPNDSDVASNGTVALLGNLGERELDEGGGVGTVIIYPSKGGGTLAPLILLLMGLPCFVRVARQQGSRSARSSISRNCWPKS